ncbi:MAG: CDP-alcohol phosphatidyltransferase family protein [Pseudomonadota bacterium]
MKADMKLAGLLGISALLIIFYGLNFIASNPIALQWLLQASLLWSWVWRATWQRRELNRLYAGAALLTHLGFANRLTLLRGFLIALTGGFLFQPQAEGFIGWVPGLAYGTAAILDRLDGFVARKTKQTTLLGAELDTAFDALGLLIAPILAVGFGKIHWSYLLLSVAFYIFQWRLQWRRNRGLAVYPLMPSQLRRTLAGFQMGFIALILLPIFHTPQTHLWGFAFMLPALLGFVVDWLVVSGRINSGAITTKHFFAGLAEFSEAIFQPALRILLALGLLYLIHQMGLTLDSILTSTRTNIVFVSGLALGTSLVLLGWGGRIGAFIILLMLGIQPITLNGLHIAVMCCAIGLLLLGTGRFSLWQWDDAWVNRQDGA